MTKLLDLFLCNLLKVVFYILRTMPIKASVFISYLIVRLILLFFPRHRYVSFRNMDIIMPGLNKNEKEDLLKKNYIVMAKNVIGLAKGKYLTKDNIIKNLDVSDARDAINSIQEKREHGTLILTPHFGSFELLALYWSLYDRPVSIVARGFGLTKTDTWWNSLREIHGNHVINRKGAFQNIISKINCGENVAILFDQNVKSNHAIFVPFFGLLAATTKTTALVSLRTGCPIVLTSMVEVAPEKYKLYAYQIKRPAEREGTIEEKIENTILEAHMYLEDIIKKHPEQWFWIHRRFKTRPQGEAESIYDQSIHPA